MSGAPFKHVVVVGGGLAGARSCEQLRRQGFTGRITLLGAEHHLPYDRPPLSKKMLSDAHLDTTFSVDYTVLDVDLRLGVQATGLRPSDRVVMSSDGELPYDGLIIATGSSPVRLAGPGEQLVVRTIDDAHRLRSRLKPGADLVIAGASWIGGEVATAALSAGCSVSCASASMPLARAFGERVGKRLLSWWDDVDMRLGTTVERVIDGGVVLSDGDVLSADVVVTGIGVRPETAWLEGSGLELDGGVVVDEWLRAAPGVVAVGDVATWWSRRWGRRLRLEHWDDAASAPAVAVAALLKPHLCHVEPYDPIPYFWSDQFGHKLQYIGLHNPDDDFFWREEAKWWTAGWQDGSGRLSAALIADRPRELARARQVIAAGQRLD